MLFWNLKLWWWLWWLLFKLLMSYFEKKYSFFFFNLFVGRNVCYLFYDVWFDHRYKQLTALQSYIGTVQHQKANNLSDFYCYIIRNKFSSWTWSSKQAWNVILLNGEFQTFYRGNPREKWPLSRQKSLAANCWHLYFWWCSEIPCIWGWANRVN